MLSRCEICSVPESDHGGIRHPFVRPGEDPGSAITNDPKKRKVQQSAEVGVARMSGGDPVLRLALINRGVISLADIIAAEQAIAAASAGGKPVYAEAGPPGRPEDSPAHT